MHLDGLYVVDDDVVVTRARDPHPQRARWRGFCFSGTRASMRSSVPLSMWSVAPVFGWQDRRAVYDSAWRARSDGCLAPGPGLCCARAWHLLLTMTTAAA